MENGQMQVQENKITMTRENKIKLGKGDTWVGLAFSRLFKSAAPHRLTQAKAFMESGLGQRTYPDPSTFTWSQTTTDRSSELNCLTSRKKLAKNPHRNVLFFQNDWFLCFDLNIVVHPDLSRNSHYFMFCSSFWKKNLLHLTTMSGFTFTQEQPPNSPWILH